MTGTLDLYRYDADCSDESVFLESTHEDVTCPFCGSGDCLELIVHWTAETTNSITAEM